VQLPDKAELPRNQIYARAGLLELALGGSGAKLAKKVVDGFIRDKFSVKATRLSKGEGYRGLGMV
jgi:hypothetical protein